MTRYQERARKPAWPAVCGAAFLILLVSAWSMPAPARIAPPIKSGDIQGGEGTPYEDPELGPSAGSTVPPQQRGGALPTGATGPGSGQSPSGAITQPAAIWRLSWWDMFVAWFVTMLRAR
jgi:hypothetical protein